MKFYKNLCIARVRFQLQTKKKGENPQYKLNTYIVATIEEEKKDKKRSIIDQPA